MRRTAGLRWRLQQLDVLPDDVALAAQAFDLDGDELAALDELFAHRVPSGVIRPPRVRLRGAETAEHVGAADGEQTVSLVPRQELVPELIRSRDLVREDVGRQQTFKEVVVPAVPVASRETEHTGDGARLEHCAYHVGRHPEPVRRRSVLALEVERRERALRADPLEHTLGYLVCSQREHEARSGSTSRETTGTRSPARGRAPCCMPRRSPCVRRARRTTRARTRRLARAARGRASDRQRQAGRTGSTRACGRPRGRHQGLLREIAPARESAGRRESAARPQR